MSETIKNVAEQVADLVSALTNEELIEELRRPVNVSPTVWERQVIGEALARLLERL